MMDNILRLALEQETSTGVAAIEVEHVIYAKMDNFDFLANAASSEIHEQWSVSVDKSDDNATSGTIRVRKTSVRNTEGEPVFVLTTKTKPVAGVTEGSVEVAIPCQKDTFKQFKLLSDFGMVKERFVFPVSGSELKFEVDVFFKKGTSLKDKDYQPWIKIDIEVPSLATPVPTLPFVPVEVIDRSKAKLTEEEEGKVTHLYDTIFLTKNKYLKPD